MPVRGGKFVLPGSGDTVITGLGFSPDLILFFWTGTTVEGTVQANGTTGLGYACRTNNLPGTVQVGPACASTSEFWSGNTASSAYLSTFAHWVKGSHGGGGFAVSCRSLNLDGFTMGYDPDFTGGVGHQVYYLAVGEEPDLLTKRGYFTESIGSMVTPFPPYSGISVGSGGLGSGGGGGGSFVGADVDIATWGLMSTFDPNPGSPPDDNGIFMQRGLKAGSSVATWLNSINTDMSDFEPRQIYADGILLGGGLDLFGNFRHTADDTHYLVAHDHDAPGFIAHDGRISVAAIGGLLAEGGQVTPSSVIGGEVEVITDINVEFVVFLCPSHTETGDITANTVGGTGFGYMEPNSQAICSVAADYQTATAQYQSPDHAWISNMTQPVGGAPSLGRAEITPNGFKVITEANDQPMAPIMYMAFGFVQDGAGFFRVVHR